MDNHGFIDEVKRKCSKMSTKKKSSDSMIFSTISLMKSISNDDETDLTSQLNTAIAEDDLATIRYLFHILIAFI